MFLSFFHHSWAEVSSIVCLESMMEFRGLFVALQKHALFEAYLNLYIVYVQPFLSRWPKLTHSSSKYWSNDTLLLFMGFIPLNGKKVLLINGIEYSSNCILPGCFCRCPQVKQRPSIAMESTRPNDKLAPWVQSLLYTLRILGPSNGKGLNLYSRGPGPQNSRFWGVRILRVVVFRLIAMWQHNAKTIP